MNPCRHPYIGCKVTLQNKTKDIQRAEVIKADSFCKITKIRLERFSSSVLVKTIHHKTQSAISVRWNNPQAVWTAHTSPAQLQSLTVRAVSMCSQRPVGTLALHLSTSFLVLCSFAAFCSFAAGLDVFEKYYQKILDIL